MSSARFFTCLIISNLKKRKEIKRVKVRMHLNLHKELCRLDGEVLNPGPGCCFQILLQNVDVPGNIGRGETTFLGTGTVFAYEKLWLLLSYRFLRLMSGPRKYFFEKIQSYISCSVQSDPIIHSPLQKEPETFDSGMFDRNYNNIQQQHNTCIGYEPFHRCDSPKIPSSSLHCEGSSDLFFCHYNF